MKFKIFLTFSFNYCVKQQVCDISASEKKKDVVGRGTQQLVKLYCDVHLYIGA